MRNRLLSSALPLALLLAALAGCRHAPVDAPAPAAATTPADDNLNAVLWMQASSEYRAAAAQTWRAAAARLDAALADPGWDALVPAERGNPATGLPPAVIVDVDETVLDNSPYQARLVADGVEYASASWAAWVDERRATPVPGVLEFARAAQARGVTIVYISNRTEAMQDATIANLRAAGLPVAGEAVFLGKGTVVEGCTSADSGDKACRRRLAGRDYRVLMQFGDQLGDFMAVEPNTPAARAALMATHGGWFGERWWMLPNPSYGDWQPALFGNDWRLSPVQRREAKHGALEPAQ
ncbi:acid phosphatase [Lysobacter arseniciresistens ZS79]|uniref:Acid phosphatase n=1 Tax=Lysobacter arseniciresistens ZS79 TaxID=913325 RepID=A0A0A0ER28_9GAMM|nr:HAD family acid phosphatase [Lysobacter arseniciresistens]KGM53411.1 acid phosphatase [Lysobacter arseniciresistens ZS79]